MFENGCYLRRQKRFKCATGKKTKNESSDLEQKPKMSGKRSRSDDEKPKSKRRNSINTSGTDLESSPVSTLEMTMQDQYGRTMAQTPGVQGQVNDQNNQYSVKVEANYDQNNQMIKTEASYEEQHQLPDQVHHHQQQQQQQQQLLALNQNTFGSMYPLVFNHETGQYNQENYAGNYWGHWNSHHLYPGAHHLSPQVVSMAASLQEQDQVSDIINQTTTDEKPLTAY